MFLYEIDSSERTQASIATGRTWYSLYPLFNDENKSAKTLADFFPEQEEIAF